MGSEKKHPPRGYVDRKEWLSLYERSDPGDVAKPIHVKFIPHRDFLPELIHVCAVSELEEVIQERDSLKIQLDVAVKAGISMNKIIF